MQLFNEMREIVLYSEKLQNNQLIRKSMKRMFPAYFAATLAASVSLVVDTMVAGWLMGHSAIAAVEIGHPAIHILQALTQTFAWGAIIRFTVCLGRGEKENANEAFNLGLQASLLVGVICVAICMVCANPLAMLLGGAGDPELAAMAVLYLRSYCLAILFTALNIYLGSILAVYGYQILVFVNALLEILLNAGCSLAIAEALPAEYKIAGLGLGTCIASGLCLVISFIVIGVKKIPVRLKKYHFHREEIVETLHHGVPTLSHHLADGFVSGFVNNIIMFGFGGSARALSIYAVVKGIRGFAEAAAVGMAQTSAPLFGLLYGARDKSGIKTTLKEGCGLGLLFSAIWAVVIAAVLPVLMHYYGVDGNLEVKVGVYLCLLFLPGILALKMMTQVLESTEKSNMGLMYCVVPGSVIYPLLLWLLIPTMQYYGLWISYGINGILFLGMMYLAQRIGRGEKKMALERMLCLEDSIYERVPMLDISIRSSNKDISDISKRIHDFLSEQDVSKRTAYMTSLCLDELAADFVDHTGMEGLDEDDKEIMDIKLFSEEDHLRIIIRNIAHPYNPLDFQLDNTSFSKVGVKMAQKVAHQIDYAYVYGMNIVTIDLDKA